jgi:hypothetical protein
MTIQQLLTEMPAYRPSLPILLEQSPPFPIFFSVRDHLCFRVSIKDRSGTYDKTGQGFEDIT